ncbi:hypothetical protein [Alkaliphilus metalliredigens]|uniref:hypothetical protein n=1 Tax=Alkaliphilus metalliredigens TaxID=208226 RepID=UPI0005A2AC65|nr:hypothetical protein [Alkaliphilus metalliredigens]
MKKHTIRKILVKWLIFYLLYNLIGAIGLFAGIDGFSYNFLRDDFNLQLFVLNLTRSFIAFGIVFGFRIS